MGREQGLCLECGVKKQQSQGKRKDGTKIYKKFCTGCANAKYRPAYKYKALERKVCACCGFIPTHACQMDVDHIDGNHSNNEERNLQVLCANCHRLKTFLNQDFLPVVQR